MRKILLLTPVLLVILVGCSRMMNMEEAYTVFNENKVNGYVIKQQHGANSVVLEINSPQDYTVDYRNDMGALELVCKDEENSTAILNDGDEQVGTSYVIETCQLIYDEVLDDLAQNVEHGQFFDSSYNTKYEKVGYGFKASGTYGENEDRMYQLTINTDSTELTYEDGSRSIEVKIM